MTRFPAIARFLSFGLFAFVGQFSAAITYHADKLLIAYFLGMAPVAHYSIAASLASKILSVAAASAAFVFPRAVALHSEERSLLLRDTYVQSSRLVLLLTAPLVAPGLVLADRFFDLWIGPNAPAALTASFQVLLVAYLIASASVVASNIFAGMGNTRVGAQFSLMGGALNLLFCVLLIPAFGTIGAAIASLLGMTQVFAFVAASSGTSTRSICFNSDSGCGFCWLRSFR